jgi:hypothetical protein
MDPGSNVHICNRTGVNWKQTRLPSSEDTVQAGCNSHRVEAWGEVTLDVRRSKKTALITLKKVAYLPAFIANIFSLSCCKKIHFNSKTNRLFKEDESQVCSNLKQVGGHWFLNAQDVSQPFQAIAADSTHAKSPQVIETAHISEKEYDGNTIVVAQPMRQQQATLTPSPIQKQI